jgi:hypothetical protein
MPPWVPHLTPVAFATHTLNMFRRLCTAFHNLVESELDCKGMHPLCRCYLAGTGSEARKGGGVRGGGLRTGNLKEENGAYPINRCATVN